MISIVDKRLEDSQGSLGRIFDAKITSALRDMETDLGLKMKDTIGSLWTKTKDSISELDGKIGRSFDTKLDNSLNEITN